MNVVNSAPAPSAPGAGGRAASDLIRIRLDVAYDGTNFAGWAIQHELRTVQGVLTQTLAQITRFEPTLTVAGRTDSGVHATGQVVHVDLPRPVWERMASTLMRRLTGLLPTDVRVTAIRVAHPDFNARFSALRRHYRYRVTDTPWGITPLRRYDTVAWRRPLDIAAMRAAAAALLGEHDFVAYCRRREGATTIRRLEELRWEEHTGDTPDGGRILTAHVTADAFCHSMVRSLVGALLAAGDGRRTVDWPGAQLNLRERANDVHVAPSHGLTLVRVDYPPDDELAQRAAITRRHRVLSATPEP